MTGILLVTHGGIGAELLIATRQITGSQPTMRAIGVHREDSLEDSVARIRKAVSELDDGAGVLTLVDTVGGTPYNVARRGLQGRRARIVCGVNLPMMLSLAKSRPGQDLDALAVFAAESGRAYVSADPVDGSNGKS